MVSPVDVSGAYMRPLCGRRARTAPERQPIARAGHSREGGSSRRRDGSTAFCQLVLTRSTGQGMLTLMDALDRARRELDARLREAVAADPLQALAAIGAVGRDLAARQDEAVRAAVQSHTWSEIGAALGVTKQAAHQRFA